MPGSAVKLTMRTVDALSTENRDALFWDRDLAGFGVRVYRTGRKVYIVQVRGPAGSKRAVIGRHGEIRADAARREAVVMIDRIKRGDDPVPPEPVAEPTVADLAERYMRAHVEVNCRPKTVEVFGRIVRLYIVPELGQLALSAVDRSHVSALHYRMRDKPYQANQTVSVLAKMFSLAEMWGLRPDGSNPCLHVKRFKEEKRERFLSAEEFQRLGTVLDEILEDGSETRSAVAAIRLLMLTGCRLSEVQKLRWEHVDLGAGELRLPDTKTGGRAVPLAPSAVRLLESLPRHDDNPWVIDGRKPGSYLTDLQHPWRRIRDRAGLDDVRIHDLRHSFASRALALGEGLPMIGKLLGHTQVQTTARYAHLARDTVKASAARIGDSIDNDLVATP